MSLRAPKVPSASECRPASAEAVAYSRRQARFSTRRPTACRRRPIRSHIATSLTLEAKHSPTFSFIQNVDASHHNNLFYRPYGTSYEIRALARSSGKVIERCWFLGACQMLLRDGKLPLVFQGTAAKPLARRIPARSRHCRPNRTAGEWWTSREVSDRSGRQAAPDFARSDIRFSLFDGECPRRKSIAGKSSLPTKAGAMRKAASFLRDFRPASGGGRAFFGTPGMARTAVTGAIRPEWCPVDDLEVRVLSWAPSLF